MGQPQKVSVENKNGKEQAAPKSGKNIYELF